MDDLARGWTIVMAHMHGHHLAVWIAILTSLAGSWIAIWTACRKPNKTDAEDESLRPKTRAPLPGRDRGAFRG